MDDSKDSESFTLEMPDPAAYKSGPTPLTPGKLSEQLQESDRASDRRRSQTWALAIIITLAASVLVLISHLM